MILYFICNYTLLEKNPKMSHLNFSIFAFVAKFCSIKIGLSGNTVWPQVSVFRKLANLTIFGIFQLTLVNSKCKQSSKWDFFCDFQTQWNSYFWRKRNLSICPSSESFVYFSKPFSGFSGKFIFVFLIPYVTIVYRNPWIIIHLLYMSSNPTHLHIFLRTTHCTTNICCVHFILFSKKLKIF